MKKSLGSESMVVWSINPNKSVKEAGESFDFGRYIITKLLKGGQAKSNAGVVITAKKCFF